MKLVEIRSKVALEYLESDKSSAELVQICGIYPTQSNKWVKQLHHGVLRIFESHLTPGQSRRRTQHEDRSTEDRARPFAHTANHASTNE